jgi:hypothetical protein
VGQGGDAGAQRRLRPPVTARRPRPVRGGS